MCFSRKPNTHIWENTQLVSIQIFATQPSHKFVCFLYAITWNVDICILACTGDHFSTNNTFPKRKWIQSFCSVFYYPFMRNPCVAVDPHLSELGNWHLTMLARQVHVHTTALALWNNMHALPRLSCQCLETRCCYRTHAPHRLSKTPRTNKQVQKYVSGNSLKMRIPSHI